MAHFFLWHISYFSHFIWLCCSIFSEKNILTPLHLFDRCHLTPIKSHTHIKWQGEVGPGAWDNWAKLEEGILEQGIGDGGGQLKSKELTGQSKNGSMNSLRALIKASQNPALVGCNFGRRRTHSSQGWPIHGMHFTTAICAHGRHH